MAFQYEILTAETVADLESQVEAKGILGWILAGGFVTAPDGDFHQAMYKAGI